MAKEKRNKGRPTRYRSSTAKAICMRMMDGESLRSICERDLYPARRTVLYWLASNKDFLRQYTRAREIQQELLYEECFEISDDASNDWMEKFNKEGESIGWQLNGEHVQRSKLRIETRRWAMERMAAKKYGSKKAIDHTSSDGTMSPTGKSLRDFYSDVQTESES